MCDLFENLAPWEPTRVDSIVTSFDPDTGFITVVSSDLTLDDSRSLLVVECVSVDSTIVSTIGEPDRRDGCDFEIEIYDDCRNANLVAPVIERDNISMDLYSVEFSAFSQAINTDITGCSTFQYELVSDDLSAPTYQINGLSVRAEPTNYLTDVGVHEYQIRAYLVNYVNQPINSVLSAPAYFTVSDPCKQTQILVQTSIPDDVFYIYQSGKVILPEFLSNTNFPDTVSQQAEAAGYGENVCGDNNYSVVSQFSGFELSFFDKNIYGDLIFQPTVDDAEGFYPMRIIVSKTRYSDPTPANLDFIAEITVDQGGDV